MDVYADTTKHLTTIEIGCPVIIGAGLASLSAAIELSPTPCLVLSSGIIGDNAATAWAQGGIAAAVGPDDDPELHAINTINAGAGLCEPDVVRSITAEAPKAIEWLARVGTRFDRHPDGSLALGLEGAHSRNRIVHAMGDKTGAEALRALAIKARRLPSVTLWERCRAIDIYSDDEGVTGVRVQTPSGDAILKTSYVVLATGGVGGLFRHTTNPLSSQGQGLALAFRTGAELRDLEMVQFHPTALAAGIDPMPLISEAVRGEGAIIVNNAGKKVIKDSLAARDVVSRAEWNSLLAGHQVFLDASESLGKRFPDRFPSIFEICTRIGIDPRKDLIPVRPAVHYHMGGVAVDIFGRTNVPGLFAAGEVASTGLHGANRLASNSLLEAVVCGRRVGKYLRQLPHIGISNTNKAQRLDSWLSGSIEAIARHIDEAFEPSIDSSKSKQQAAATIGKIRGILSQGAGVLRSAETLATALEDLHPYLHTDAGLIAYLIAWSARAREESRGGHTRLDFPQADEMAAHVTVSAADIFNEVRR